MYIYTIINIYELCGMMYMHSLVLGTDGRHVRVYNALVVRWELCII